jgi:hypothetical protein
MKSMQKGMDQNPSSMLSHCCMYCHQRKVRENLNRNGQLFLLKYLEHIHLNYYSASYNADDNTNFWTEVVYL